MRYLWLTIFAAILAASPAFAQPLADKVPADAIVYIGWHGSENMPAQYDDSHLKAVLDNSKIREAFSQLLPQVTEKIFADQPEAKQTAQTCELLAGQIFKHPTAIYFAGLDINRPQPMPKIALICQAGADAQAMQQLITQLLSKADNPPIHVSVIGDMLILAIGYDQPEQALATAGNALQQSPAFASALKQVQADPMMIGYADVEQLLALAQSTAQLSGDPQVTQRLGKAIDALGLGGLKRIIRTSGFDGKDWMSQTFVEAPSPRTGLMEMLDASPVSPDLLKAIPADATFVATTRFDAAKLIHHIRDAAGQIDPQFQRIIDMGLGAVHIALARDPLGDVLEPMGQDWAIYCSPSVAGNGVLGLVAVNHLKDPAKAEASLPIASVNLSNWSSIAMSHAKAGVEIMQKSATVEGINVHYVALPIVAPAWTLKDGNLYLGLYPQSVAAAARWASSGGKSISQNEKFAALEKRLGVEHPCSFSFYDLPATAGNGSIYSQWLMLDRYAGFADLFGMTLPEPSVPPLDILEQHISPAGSAAWVDDAGYHAKAISPFPGSTMLSEPGMLSTASPGGTALAISILLPSLNRARETANRVKCASNMRQIGMATIMYANEHHGKFPQSIGEMIINEDITPEAFVCPSGNTEVPADIRNAPKDKQAEWVNAHSDYIYLGAGKNSSTPPQDILLYEKEQDHDQDGMNILYGDGHVEFQRLQQAKQLIAKQKHADGGL